MCAAYSAFFNAFFKYVASTIKMLIFCSAAFAFFKLHLHVLHTSKLEVKFYGLE